MTIQIKHAFTSLKGDGGDATLVRPSNWNAAHSTSMATLNILGRATAGAGSFEELPTSAYIIAALAATDKATLLAALGIGAFETGDVKFSIDPTAPAGWLAYNGEGTISKLGAGGSILAAATAQPLYEIIYNNIVDTYAPVSGGRTGNATNDFNAGKTIGLPRFSGRAVIGAGTGSGLTARLAGAYAGVEAQTLTASNIPTITSAGDNMIIVDSDRADIHFGGNSDNFQSIAGSGTRSAFSVSTITSRRSNNIAVSSTNTGGGAAHNTMMPYTPLWAKVKL
jgi:microcystin-dependent protein